MSRRPKSFYPDYLLEILVTVFLACEAVILLALLLPQPIGRKIDFAAPFQPMPEWYFLWLYELIRFFPGKWVGVGTFFLPSLAFLLLAAIPFIDSGTRGGRRTAVAAGSLLLFGFLILTWMGMP